MDLTARRATHARRRQHAPQGQDQQRPTRRHPPHPAQHGDVSYIDSGGLGQLVSSFTGALASTAISITNSGCCRVETTTRGTPGVFSPGEGTRRPS